MGISCHTKCPALTGLCRNLPRLLPLPKSVLLYGGDKLTGEGAAISTAHHTFPQTRRFVICRRKLGIEVSSFEHLFRRLIRRDRLTMFERLVQEMYGIGRRRDGCHTV